MTESFTSIGRAFENAYPGSHVRFNFGPSDGLANGIRENGGADVFASASEAPMDLVEQDPGILERRVFARNRLVLIVPKDNRAKIRALSDVARTDVRLALAAPGVPAGKYARRILKNAGLVAGLPHAPSSEIDVKGVVEKVVLGEADAGIVYATDVTVKVSESVTSIAIPEAVDVVVTYPIAVLAGSKNRGVAGAFVAYVLGDGRPILRAAGFLPPG